MARTLVGTPNPDVNRKARLAWVAQTLRLPLQLAVQGARKAGRMRGRNA